MGANTEVSAGKNAVYDAVAKLAGQAGLNVDNQGTQFPESSLLDHYGFKTPRDYKVIGDVTVLHNDDQKPNPSFQVIVAPNDYSKADNAVAFGEKLSAAIEGAGLSDATSRPYELGRTGNFAGNHAGADVEASRLNLAEQLTVQLGTPGLQADGATGHQVGENKQQQQGL